MFKYTIVIMNQWRIMFKDKKNYVFKILSARIIFTRDIHITLT